MRESPGQCVPKEYNYVTQGGATSINTTFDGARFADNINAGLQLEFTYYQQFAVQVGGINATPGFVPVMVSNRAIISWTFWPEQYTIPSWTTIPGCVQSMLF
jgi:hypothetical protein